MEFKCVFSFTSTTGKRFYHNDVINEHHYNRLTSIEKRNFEVIGGRSYEDNDTDLLDVGLATLGFIASSNSDDTNEDSTSIFNGFSGGDSGGGGSTDEW